MPFDGLIAAAGDEPNLIVGSSAAAARPTGWITVTISATISSVLSDTFKMQAHTASRSVLVLQTGSLYTDLIEEIFANSTARPKVVTLPDSDQALTFLRDPEAFAATQRPDLILLDLETPSKTESYTLLSTLKQDPLLRRIPIIVLTASSSSEDILKSYALQGNCYIIRPGDRAQLIQSIKRIEEFWLHIVTLPSECSPC